MVYLTTAMKLKTSAFAFMISSVFSQYKDIGYVISTKYLKAENLFDIVEHIIIGLEEIGFQVSSIITDNNTIDKNVISFFCCPPKLSIEYPHQVIKSRPLFFLFDTTVHISNTLETIGLVKKMQIK